MRELRFLITELCNYNCPFCHHEGMEQHSFSSKKLKAADYVFIYEVFKAMFGNNQVTLTGGEPLLRSDITEIVRSLKNSGAEITIVSNGFLVNKSLEALSCIKRLNISLHSMEADYYQQITNTSNKSLSRVVENIKLARQTYPELEIRFNVALIKGLNNFSENLIHLINFAKSVDASIKFIELYPPNSAQFVPIESIIEDLENYGFSKAKENFRQITYLDKTGTKIVLTKIFCAYAASTPDPKAHCQTHQDLFITPDGGVKHCMNNMRCTPIYESVVNRDNLQLQYQLNYSINHLGNCQ